MKQWIFVCIALCLLSASFGSPMGSQEVVSRAKRDTTLLENNQRLIEELVRNLQNAAQQASDAVVQFGIGMRLQSELFRQKVLEDIANLRARVQQSIQDLGDKVQTSGAGISTCIETHRTEAEKVFKETVSKTMSCADERISSISERVADLANMTNDAVQYADDVLVQLRGCSEQHGDSVWATGTCMGGIVLRTQLRSAMFGVQSGIATARINLSITTLPVALQGCAGLRVLEASAAAARIALDAGACSTANIYNTFTGNDNALAQNNSA